jgi:hypothetical protein
MHMRMTLVAIAAAVSLVGVAYAHDYVVVNSTDPAHAKGAGFEGGAVVQLAEGSSLTVVSSLGRVSNYRGGAGVVTLPPLAGAASQGAGEALASIMRRPTPRRITGAMRGADACAPADALKTLDEILAAEAAGCRVSAKLALESYLAAESGTAQSEPAPAPH